MFKFFTVAIMSLLVSISAFTADLNSAKAIAREGYQRALENVQIERSLLSRAMKRLSEVNYIQEKGIGCGGTNGRTYAWVEEHHEDDIHICANFADLTDIQGAELLAHEMVHTLGDFNECRAVRVQVFVMKALGYPSYFYPNLIYPYCQISDFQ